MKSYFLENYTIQTTEKSDFDPSLTKYPSMEWAIRCKQIHSNTIHEYHADWDNEIQGDGIISDQRGIKLSVWVSDCNAVAIMGKTWFGIVHAWWKGLQSGIIQNLFKKLKEKGESEFSVFVGPSIRVCCYQVGEEFTKRCAPEFLKRDASWKLYFDMLGMISSLVKNEHCTEVIIDPSCTKCSKNFFSYRRGDGINNFISVTKK